MNPVWKWLAIITVIISIAILGWSFNKAFDLTDGGFNLLRYSDRQPLEKGSYAYDHVLIRAILPSSLRQIIPLRIMAVVLTLCSTFLLSFAIFRTAKALNNHSKPFFFTFWLVYAGFVMSFAGSPTDLSYNTLNQFFVLSAAALLCLALGSKSPTKYIVTILSGIFTAPVFLSKLPSGLALCAVATVLLFFAESKLRRLILLYWLGLVLSLLLAYMFVKPDFISHYWNGHLILNQGNEYGSELLISSIYKAFLQNLNAFLKALFIVGCARLSSNRTYRLWRVVFMLLAMAYLLYILLSAVSDHLRGSMLVSDTLMFIVYLLVLTQVIRKHEKPQLCLKRLLHYLKVNSNKVLLVLFLFIVPYVGALGTNNSLNWGAKFYYSALLGALVLADSRSSRLMRISTAIIALYMIVAGLYIYVRFPYRSTPLYTQTVVYKGIKYHPEKARFLKATEDILKANGFESGQGIITAYKSPGLVFLMHSFQPGGILWSAETEDFYFRLLSETKLTAKPVIISFSSPPTPEFCAKLLASTNLDMSIDYYSAGIYDYFEDSRQVFVYFPYHPYTKHIETKSKTASSLLETRNH